MSNTRIYAVTPKVSEAPQVRLVEASNQAQAMRHVAKDTMNVTVASQQDLVKALGSGVKVETAAVETLGE